MKTPWDKSDSKQIMTQTHASVSSDKKNAAAELVHSASRFQSDCIPGWSVSCLLCKAASMHIPVIVWAGGTATALLRLPTP